MKKLLFILALLSFTNCMVTYETPKCELMQRGQPCLTNYICCNATYNNNYRYKPHLNWLYWSKPVNNYIIVKPNNKPNKPNKPNRPSRKHRK